MFDPEDRGEAENWPQVNPPFDRTIEVPFAWESHAAWGTEAVAGNENYFSPEVYRDPRSVTRDNYREALRHTLGWYRRTITTPPLDPGQRLWLHLGAADWEVRVWVNGTLAGCSDSGYVPVGFDITGALQGDEATVVIRVHDPQGTEDKPLGKQHNWYTTTSGIWQTVWLEVRPEVHLHNLRLTPALHPARITCEATANLVPTDLQVRYTLTDADGQVAATAVSEIGNLTATLELGDEARLWSPDSPHLYAVQAELWRGDTLLDTLHSTCGLREIAVAPLYPGGPKYVTLNGRPLYLKGALDQSFNPWGVYTFPSDEAIRCDLELARAAGFNFLRLHIKPEDPRLLYWADRLGMLLMADLPNLGYQGYGETGCRRWEWTFRRIVERDYNHPSIFCWVLFNETWGLGGEGYKQQPERHEWVESMVNLARQLDPSRLIEDNSPCLYDHVVTDLNTWHFYINDYEQAREHVEQVVSETSSGSGFNYVPGRQQGDEPLLNSEYGGIGARQGDLDVSWCFKFLTDLLRREKKIAGYVYTELQDIEWEYNGIYDYDRRPKDFGYRVVDLQGPVYVGLDAPPAQTVVPGETITLPVFVNRAGYEGKLPPLTVSVSGQDTLGEALEVLPATIVPLPDSDQPVLAFELPPVALPAQPCLLKVAVQLGELAANWAYLEVRARKLPACEQLADGTLVLRKLAGEVEVSTAWHEAEVERGLIDYETHLLGGIEAGNMDYRFALPEGFDAAACRSLTLLLEASSKRLGAPQTSEDLWPSDLTTSLNGVVVDQRILPDQPADSRGALSHLHGLRGRYGQLVRVEVSGERLREVLAARPGEVAVRLEVPRSAFNHRGLTVYSSRAGSVPCDVTLLVR
jgi:hypothetical protein